MRLIGLVELVEQLRLLLCGDPTQLAKRYSRVILIGLSAHAQRCPEGLLSKERCFGALRY